MRYAALTGPSRSARAGDADFPHQAALSMTDTVLIEKRDGYRVLTLNRPERLNAINCRCSRT